jgi:hypothetical protein
VNAKLQADPRLLGDIMGGGSGGSGGYTRDTGLYDY